MIFVDSREPEIVAIEAALGGGRIQRVDLPAGDILVSAIPDAPLEKAMAHGFLVERKAAGDFLHSLADGRLFHQAMRMVQLCPRPIIVIQGEIRPMGGKVQANGRPTNWNLWSIRMAILRLQLAGVPVLEIGPRDLPDLIRHLVTWLEKPRTGVPRSVPDPLRPISPETWFLAQIPGIGEEKASALMNRFESAAACLVALSDGQAVDVRGIGPTLIAKARAFLGLQEGEKLCLKR